MNETLCVSISTILCSKKSRLSPSTISAFLVLKISMKSPLGHAVMGKKKGETFSFESPSGMMSYKIIDIK